MDPSERREIVSRFLRRCVTYADASIERKKSRGDDEKDISNWEIYRQFTSLSASEVESGELDTWLEDGDYESEPDNYYTLDGEHINSKFSELSHNERRPVNNEKASDRIVIAPRLSLVVKKMVDEIVQISQNN